MMSTAIRLIVGLGNPGPDYETTRHNAGFWLADHVADDLRASYTLEKGFFAMVAKARHAGESVLLAKPITYMNRSGQAVGALEHIYKLRSAQVLVRYDEIDVLTGQDKLQKGGGYAGHNGLKDIQAALGSANFWRVRIGIGHPRTLGLAQQVAVFVLHPPRRDEQGGIDDVIHRCRTIVPAMLDGDFALATRQLHSGNGA